MSVRPLPEAELAALSTKRLLAYRKRLLSLEDSAEKSDWDAAELSQLDPDLLRFKDDPAWNDVYAAVKRILAEREHIPRS